MLAKDDLEKMKKAIAVIELVTPYYFNENLKLYKTGKLIPVNRELKLYTNDSAAYIQIS